MQWGVVIIGVKIIKICGIMTIWCEVRNNIGCIGTECHRSIKGGLLPTSTGFIAKRYRCKQGAGCGPKMSYMRSGITGSFVEFNSGYLSADIRFKFQPNFYSIGV